MSKSRMAGLFQTSAGNPRFGGPLPTIDPRIMAVGPKGYTDYASLAQERASNRKYAWTTDGANAPPMSRAIEARARTQPVRQIWVGQKLAANGNQIRIAFPEPCFRGKPSAATVRLMLSPSWRRHPRGYSPYSASGSTMDRPLWVKRRNTLAEHMFSASPPTTDMRRLHRNDGFVPHSEIARFLRSPSRRSREARREDSRRAPFLRSGPAWA
jgi:hypothetical protein